MKSAHEIPVLKPRTSRARARPAVSLTAAADRIIASGAFDLSFYRAQVGRSLGLVDAVKEYIASGEERNIRPHPLFVPSYVKSQLSDLKYDSELSVLLTYLDAPDETIDPHPLFDADYYRRSPGIAARAHSGLEDYLRRVRAGEMLVSPNVLFDAEFYRALYADVDKSGLDAFGHYLTVGWKDGRRPHPLFDVAFWENSLGDLRSTNPGKPALLDYRERKETWPAAPHPLFDPLYYREQLERRGLQPNPKHPPLADMLLREPQISSHYLFDVEFYARQAELAARELTEHPLLDYVRTRGRGGLDPHPLFHSRFYLSRYPEAATADDDPLTHFVQVGAAEKRDPNPLFSQRYYGEQNAHLKDAGGLLRHYIEHGGRELRDPHPLFEAGLYAAYHPESLDGQDNPLAHYARSWAERGLRFPPWGTQILPRYVDTRNLRCIDVVLVTHEATNTGAPRILLKILQHLTARCNLHAIVLAAAGGALLENFREWASVIDLSAIPRDVAAPADFLALVTMALARRGGPKLCVVNTACVSKIGEALAASGMPVVTLVHELAASFPYEDFRTIYDSSRLVIYPAQFVRREAHGMFPLDLRKTEVIPQGLLDSDFGQGEPAEARRMVLEEINAPPDAFIVFGCGSIDLRKGIDVFVKVAAAVINKMEASAPERLVVHFVWVGDGVTDSHSPFWYAKEDARRSGVAERIHFLGPKIDTEPYFQACDALLLPSRLDPFPCVVHEAMASGKPIVVFENAGGAPEALEDGAGITVPYGDVDAMAMKVRELVADPGLARQYGQKARSVVHEKYVFADYVEQILQRTEQRLGRTLFEHGAAAVKPQRRRVIFTLSDWQWNSTQSFVERLAKGLMVRGLEAELVFTETRPNWWSFRQPPDIPYRFLAPTHRRVTGLAERWAALVDVFGASAPAIYIHGHGPGEPVLAANAPDGIGILGILHEDNPNHFEQAARLGLRQRTVATSPEIFERVRDAFPTLIESTVQIPCGVTAADAPSAREPGLPTQIVAQLPSGAGRERLKLLRALVDAMRSCGGAFSLALVCDGSDAKTATSEFEFEHAVGIVRTISLSSHRNIEALLRHTDLLISFDLKKPIIDPLEAMALGVPILVVSAGIQSGASDLVVDGSNGFVVDPAQPDKSVQRLTEFATRADLRLKMRRAAYDTGRARTIDMEVVSDRYAELVETMLREIGSATHAIGKAAAAGGQADTSDSTAKWRGVVSLAAAPSEPPIIARADKGMSSAERVRLDESSVQDKYRHLDISAFALSIDRELWPRVKFKFCLSASGRFLEFRERAEWPIMFTEFSGAERDSYGMVLRLFERDFGTVAHWRSDRDQRLVRAIATLLPAAVESFIGGGKLSASEREMWLAEARSFSEKYLNQATATGPIAPEIVADADGTLSTAERVILDEHYASADYRHLDISLMEVTTGGEVWPQIKFKFCRQGEKCELEFRETQGWPVIFEEFPGTVADAWGLVLKLSEEGVAAAANWRSDRDKLLLNAIAVLLPSAVMSAAEQSVGAMMERDLWVAEARKLSNACLRGLQQRHENAASQETAG